MMAYEFLDKTETPSLKVSVLPTGYLKHPDRWLFEDGDINVCETYPDFSFLIEHPSGRKVLFDLGMPKDFTVIPPLIRAGFNIVQPYVPKDIREILLEGPVYPSSIDTVILSHLHFDHTGDFTQWPHSIMLAGPGSREAAAPGWPDIEKSIFASGILRHPKYAEFSYDETRDSTGPFPKSFDVFDDGSLLLLDCPGHMAGHIGALAKTDQEEWVFFGGDCCHHPALLAGRRPMSVTVGPAGTSCFHKDPAAAQSTMHRVRSLQNTGKVLICLAHDNELDGVIPEYPARINGWKHADWYRKLRLA